MLTIVNYESRILQARNLERWRSEKIMCRDVVRVSGETMWSH